MNLDEMTLGDAKQLIAMFGGKTTCSNHPYQIGKNYFIRTVTMIQVGRLIKVTEQELVLEDAIWVADTGRFTQALENGDLDEVETFPAGEVIVGRGAVVDACVWINQVVREQK